MSTVAVSVLGTLLAAASLAPGYYTFGNGYGLKWGDPAFGTRTVVTWGFMADGTGVDPGFRIDPWAYPDISGVVGTSNITQLRNAIDAIHGDGAFDAAVARAFDTWAAAADVTFVGPLADSGLPINDPGAHTPQIRIGAFQPDPNHSFVNGPAVGFAPPPNGGTLEGDILFNLSLPLQIAPGDEDSTPINYFHGNDLEGLLLHELGHAAIGLGHPLEGNPDTQTDSVMYVGPGCCGNINRQLADDDIAGARHVYGLRGDIDRDGHVNVFDIFAIGESWNTADSDPAFNPDCDLDYDGSINIFDIFVLAENWNLQITP